MELVDGNARIDDVEAFLAALDEVGERHDATVQAFDARLIVDARHLERAVELADRAVERGENVARDRGVEIMLYAAGRRQIDQALALGVEEGAVPVVVVVDEASDVVGTVADVRDLLEDDAATLGEYDEDRVMEYYGITEAERDATAGDVPDLVHERVALLTVER